MDGKFCQSCGMPMCEGEDVYGTNADGSKSEDYCSYCYADGAFTSECTMDEMIEICVPHVVEFHADMDEDGARNMMKEFFPKLKRWAM